MLTIPTKRLQNQRIEYPQPQSPAHLLTCLGAIQGQDYTGAKWSLGLRLPGSTDAQIEQAIIGKTIARTWLMRGTLHLVATEDIGWMVELLAPRIIAQSATRYRELELDEESLRHGNAVLVKALEGGKQLTRKELFAILEQNNVSTQGQRGIHLLRHASLCGLIFQGVMERNDPSFMRLDEALPPFQTKLREEALAELARRYFRSRGPATLPDFVGWSGLLTAEARTGLEAVKGELTQETIDGELYWLPPKTYSEPEPSPKAYALPGFDEYLLGYKGRDIVLEPQHASKVCPGGNGVFHPTIVINGRIVGLWKRTLKKDKALIVASPFDPLSKPEREAFAVAIRRYGEFLQMPVEVIYSSPHSNTSSPI